MSNATSAKTARPAQPSGPSIVAVLDAGHVYTEDGARLSVPADMPLSAILERARARKIRDLWAHPSYLRGRDLAAWLNEARRAGWTITPDTPASWMSAKQPAGTYGIVSLSLTTFGGMIPWEDAKTGADLLKSVLAFRRAVGVGYAYSPGATGRYLLRSLHTGKGQSLDLAASMSPADYPAPARDDTTEHDFDLWMRLLTQAERGSAYVHAYDKNAAYLAACSSLPVGFGKPRHVQRPTFDKRTPGYWLVRVRRPAGFSPLLPFPVGCGPSYAHEGERWMSTATLTLAYELDAVEIVGEAWIWPETHEPLTPWYKRLRDARATLKGTDHIADVAVKATYSFTIGGFSPVAQRDSQEPDKLYRPDWRHAVIAQCRCNLYRNAATVYAASGRAPIAVLAKDTLLYVSDEADPVKAAPGGLRMGDTPGLFKPKWSMPMGRVADILASVTADERSWNRAADALAKRVG